MLKGGLLFSLLHYISLNNKTDFLNALFLAGVCVSFLDNIITIVMGQESSGGWLWAYLRIRLSYIFE